MFGTTIAARSFHASNWTVKGQAPEKIVIRQNNDGNDSGANAVMFSM